LPFAVGCNPPCPLITGNNVAEADQAATTPKVPATPEAQATPKIPATPEARATAKALEITANLIAVEEAGTPATIPRTGAATDMTTPIFMKMMHRITPKDRGSSNRVNIMMWGRSRGDIQPSTKIALFDRLGMNLAVYAMLEGMMII
jgi:hypothetical protein